MNMRVTVSLRRAELRPGGCRAHSGRYHIDLSVNGASIGNRDHAFGDGEHQLGGSDWSHDFDDPARLSIRCRVRDGDCWSEEVEQTWQAPFPALRTIVGSGWLVELAVASARRARRASNRVSVPRSSSTARHRVTALAPSARIRFEIDPVIPMPQRLASRRPAWTHEFPPTFERADLLAGGSGTSALVNPAVIARTTDASWTATISYTRVWAPGRSEAELNRNVRWRVRSLAGGAQASFIGGDRGMSVRVRGTDADGEVAIDAMLGTRVLATHRALVRQPVVLPIRFTDTEVPPNMATFQDPSGRTMMGISTRRPGHLTRAINLANRRLEALALRLAPEPNARVVGEHTQATDEAACFVRRAQNAEDIAPPESLLAEMVRRSAVPHVVSFVVASALPAGASGIAAIPCLANGNVTDSGTPSSSWDAPSGVPPSPAATQQTIQPLTAHLPQYHTRVAGSLDDIYGGLLAMLAGGDTLAHEVGHVLGMRHRDPQADGRPARPENLMMPGGGAGDFDILQARVAWSSALVRHWYQTQHGSAPP